MVPSTCCGRSFSRRPSQCPSSAYGGFLWLLLFQLLLLLLAVLAPRPYFFRTHPASLQVVILDASASMQAGLIPPDLIPRAGA